MPSKAVVFANCLTYPVSANRYWATRVIVKSGKRPVAMTYVTPEAKAYKLAIQSIARDAGVTTPILGRVELRIKLYPHRPLDYLKRQKLHGNYWDDTVQCIDLGNSEKVISDALKNVVMEDDKWIWRIISERMKPDDGGARAVVAITEIL